MLPEKNFIELQAQVQSQNHQKAGFFWTLLHFVERMRLAVALLLVVLVFSSVSLQAASPSAKNSVAKANNNQLVNPADIFYINKINNLRSKAGKPPLAYNAVLEQSAYLKARDMVSNNYWGHYSPSGESFSDFIWRQSPDSQRVGENLARCFVTRQSAFEALVASPTHYAIMVGDFSTIGVSELANTNDGCTYTILHFAKN